MRSTLTIPLIAILPLFACQPGGTERNAVPQTSPPSSQESVPPTTSQLCSNIKKTLSTASSTISNNEGNVQQLGEELTDLSSQATLAGEPAIADGIYALSSALTTPQKPGTQGYAVLWDEAERKLDEAEPRTRRLCGFTLYGSIR